MAEASEDQDRRLPSKPLTLSMGVPQGCVPSPWLFSLCTNRLTSHHSSVSIYKCADDTTITGLITNNNEDHHCEQVTQAVTWCQDSSLQLNISKTKELIMDFRKKHDYIYHCISTGRRLRGCPALNSWSHTFQMTSHRRQKPRH